MVRFRRMPPRSRVPSERGTLFSSTVTVIGTSDGERLVSCPIFHGFAVQYDNCKGRLLYRDLKGMEGLQMIISAFSSLLSNDKVRLLHHFHLKINSYDLSVPENLYFIT
ncbi:hypothetical protein CDAR_167431 [Caerostris darwini]|uniref:Uncharacterized protein n=1 Tax=Caerostris darwini TaxID=1538125 RepID=A0AAV4NI49_9ARAC|nr:hypothetical protein CDAR_167431 [Caerostris darwini]